LGVEVLVILPEMVWVKNDKPIETEHWFDYAQSTFDIQENHEVKTSNFVDQYSIFDIQSPPYTSVTLVPPLSIPSIVVFVIMVSLPDRSTK